MIILKSLKKKETFLNIEANKYLQKFNIPRNFREIKKLNSDTLNALTFLREKNNQTKTSLIDIANSGAYLQQNPSDLDTNWFGNFRS